MAFDLHGVTLGYDGCIPVGGAYEFVNSVDARAYVSEHGQNTLASVRVIVPCQCRTVCDGVGDSLLVPGHGSTPPRLIRHGAFGLLSP